MNRRERRAERVVQRKLRKAMSRSPNREILTEVLRENSAAFEARFGRPMRDADPVLWDRSAVGDEPVAETEENIRQTVIDVAVRAETPPPHIYAFRRTGHFAVVENWDLLTEEERDAWDDAALRGEELERRGLLAADGTDLSEAAP